MVNGVSGKVKSSVQLYMCKSDESWGKKSNMLKSFANVANNKPQTQRLSILDITKFSPTKKAIP